MKIFSVPSSRKSFDDDKDMGKCLVNAANDNPKMILCIIDNNRANR